MTAIVLRSAWQGLRSTGLMGGVAVATIATALFMLGAFALVVVNMEGLLDDFGRELQVTAYLEEGLAEGQAEELAGPGSWPGRGAGQDGELARPLSWPGR